jgi:hypothetical protein
VLTLLVPRRGFCAKLAGGWNGTWWVAARRNASSVMMMPCVPFRPVSYHRPRACQEKKSKKIEFFLRRKPAQIGQ